MVEAVTTFEERDNATAAELLGEQLRLVRHRAEPLRRHAHAPVRIARRRVLAG